MKHLISPCRPAHAGQRNNACSGLKNYLVGGGVEAEALADAGVTVRLCYREFVKNITVSIPDDVYRRARITAAERDTSLSAMVRRFLMTLGQEESDSERRKRLQQEVPSTVRRFRAGDRLTREQVHQRNAFR